MYEPELLDNLNHILAPVKSRLLDLGMKKLNFDCGEVVLDVGCGQGYVTSRILLPKITTHLEKLVATDVNKDMIKVAEEKYRHPKIEYKALDFSEEITEEQKRSLISGDFASLEFDKIFSVNCLMLIQDQRLVARNLYSLLKPGGEALIILCAKSLDFEIYRVLSKNGKWKKYLQDVETVISPYQDSEDPLADFSKNFQSAGLQVKGCVTEFVKYDCRNPTNCRDLLTGCNLFLNKVPHTLQEQYMGDCISVMKRLRDPDNLYFDYLCIVANLFKPIFNLP